MPAKLQTTLKVMFIPKDGRIHESKPARVRMVGALQKFSLAVGQPLEGVLAAAQKVEVRAVAVLVVAILRVADGLNRTHAADITEVNVVVDRDRVRFDCVAASDPAVCLWGAERRADLLAEVFGRSPEFVWFNAAEVETDHDE